MKPQAVIKRDGSTVPWDGARIAHAIGQALAAVGDRDEGLSDELARVVEGHLARVADRPEVELEEIQDAVVHVLQESGNYEVAIAYARYRDARERARRERRARGEPEVPVHLMVVDLDGRRRLWDRPWFTELVAREYGLRGVQADDVLALVEDQIAQTASTELTAGMLLSLADAALVRLGLTGATAERAPVRVPRAALRMAVDGAEHGGGALAAAGRMVLRQDALVGALPPAVLRLHCRGRLWVDGLDDPRRGSQLTLVVEPSGNPFLVLAQAQAAAIEAVLSWRRVRIVLPPAILGHLERGAPAIVGPVAALGRLAQVHLYCDGRTPLIERWPFAGSRVGLATYNDDFLLARTMSERQLPLMSGAHCSRGGWQHRVAVEVALNAQGLEGEWSQLDALAMAAATAARIRRDRLGQAFAGADLRFAIFGLAQSSPASEYLERQVVQEGLRLDLPLVRSTGLCEEACAHLGRLLEG
jgi:hypothetical protein